ncbi:MAG: hypothetical protein A2855_00445 [Candidatus Liptonbacteria bacterium RIFCSPHIGHO2_01_FULL_57_28]|uniref:HTH deoR-type domain-containing protein n=1 Tax=Candidatus Liptonbacteria bacterium RIFCSPHIGHO2_01_FULL_57_28 TaxID=1798647 RepID=A0A1G2CA76_9BACT|nr:MAG: hypothetical protein A2855_00445 [Candidatus Liptonbacteria bacterium RIFCSPHIGHO2_01_FULL_57_28]
MHTPLDPAAKKAYEITYAMFRVAAAAPSRALAGLMEKEALNLLRGAVGNFQDEYRNALGIIHYLIALGRDTNNIHNDNVALLVQQLDALESLLRDRSMNAVSPTDLSQIFAASNVVEPAKSLPKVRQTPQVNSIAASERQQRILERIRQSGNCRTRDLQEVLPDLSERTLRYDLQRLIEDGKIERGGGGGPASWYRIKEASQQSNVFGGASL